MRKITLHPAALACALLLAGVAAAAVEDHVAYNRGYARGSFDGQHNAVRNSASALSNMMNSGITIRQTDGSERHFVLTPVETQSHVGGAGAVPESVAVHMGVDEKGNPAVCVNGTAYDIPASGDARLKYRPQPPRSDGVPLPVLRCQN